MLMKILLLQNVAGQGKKGDLIEVNIGYARNYLIPKKLGLEATPSVLNEIKQKAAKDQRELEKEIAIANDLVKRIQGETFLIKVRCGQDKMYGSVTAMDVQKSMLEKGFEVDKRKIVLKDTIKELGKYQAELKIMTNISAIVNLNVESDEK